MKALGFFAILAALCAWALSTADSRSIFPSVMQLEQQYGLYPGAPLPKQVASNAGIFDVRFVRAVQAQNGHYIVELKLEPRR